MGAARDLHGLVHLGQHLAGLIEEAPASFGQLDPTVGAFQQARTDFLFQRLDLLAQWGLGNTQLLGGAAEMQLFGHGDEVAQVSQFHGRPIDIYNVSNVSNNILEII
ncbi:hypothetical protein D9M71_200570 [compost metagenome]